MDLIEVATNGGHAIIWTAESYFDLVQKVIHTRGHDQSLHGLLPRSSPRTSRSSRLNRPLLSGGILAQIQSIKVKGFERRIRLLREDGRM